MVVEEFPTNLPIPLLVVADGHTLLLLTDEEFCNWRCYLFGVPCSHFLLCHGGLSSPLMEFGGANPVGSSCAPLQFRPPTSLGGMLQVHHERTAAQYA